MNQEGDGGVGEMELGAIGRAKRCRVPLAVEVNAAASNTNTRSLFLHWASPSSPDSGCVPHAAYRFAGVVYTALPLSEGLVIEWMGGGEERDGMKWCY